MKSSRTRAMSPGPLSTFVVPLFAGALATACTPTAELGADDTSQTEQTQSALKVVGATPVTAPVIIVTTPLPPLLTLQSAAAVHPVCGKVVRVTSADLDFALRGLLRGTRIIYDTTGSSDTHVGPYYHCWYPNEEALEAAIDGCNKLPPMDKGTCLQQANEDFPQIKECASTTAAYHSYIDFGTAAEDHGAEDMFFDSDTIRRVIWAGAFDFDINFVHTTIDSSTMSAQFTKDPSSERASARISLKLSSNNPTVICRGGLPCPDVNLSNMTLEARLPAIAPAADKTQLSFDTPEVTFHFSKNVNNVPDLFVDLFKDVDGLIKRRVEKRLESALTKAGTSAALDQALTELVEFFAHQQIDVFYGAWFDGGDLMVDYQPQSRLPVAPLGCQVATALP